MLKVVCVVCVHVYMCFCCSFVHVCGYVYVYKPNNLLQKDQEYQIKSETESKELKLGNERVSESSKVYLHVFRLLIVIM